MKKTALILSLLVSGFMLGACANMDIEPMEQPTPGEIPKGPGLFSGEDGEFVVYRK